MLHCFLPLTIFIVFFLLMFVYSIICWFVCFCFLFVCCCSCYLPPPLCPPPPPPTPLFFFFSHCMDTHTHTHTHSLTGLHALYTIQAGRKKKPTRKQNPNSSSSSSRDVFLNTWPLSLWLSPHVDIYTYFKGFAMHAIIIFLYYLSKLLNLPLNLESLSSRFLNKLILLVNFSAAGKLFQLVITLLLDADFPILEWNCFTNILPSEFLV